MNNHLKPLQPQPSVNASVSVDRFDFELWAAQVRPQLLAALQKKGAESQSKS